MRFNMGCGYNRLDGYHNVDESEVCGPDQVFDLENTPWPWSDGCATEIRFHHSLEHMGADTKVFLNIIKETYRIAAPDCLVFINVPHPRHDHFLNDPTHVRAITPDMLKMFDKKNNDTWRELGEAVTPLAHYTGVDFVLEDMQMRLVNPFAADLAAGRMTKDEVNRAIRHQYNVVSEYQIKLRARK
jgi:hypothetical protein